MKKTYTPGSLIIAQRQSLIDIIKEQSSHIDTITNEVTELKMQIDWFKRQIFGTKSERFLPADDMQEALELNIVNKKDLDAAATAKTITYNRDSRPSAAAPAQGHGRWCMPTHLNCPHCQ